MSIWNTLSSRFKTEWLNDPMFRPYRIALGKVQSLATSVEEKRTKVEAPGTLNDRGVVEALRAFVEKDVVPELRRHQHRLERAAEKVEEQRRALGVPKPDKTDVVAAMIRAEARAYVRGLSEGERAKVLMRDPDPVIIAAVFEAPGVLSGTSEEMREQVETMLVEAANPEVLARIEDEREQIKLVGAGVNAALDLVRKECGFDSEHEFDAFMTAASADVEREVAAGKGKAAFAPDLDSMVAMMKALAWQDRHAVIDAALTADGELSAEAGAAIDAAVDAAVAKEFPGYGGEAAAA